MKTIRIFILLCIISATAYSQAWVWEKPISTTNNKVTTDPLNNIILLSTNGTATQLTKYTKDGTLIWTKRLSKLAAVTPGGSAVADNSGNIYIFTAGFDSVNSVFTGVKVAGITKFNPQGNILWHTNYNVVNSGVNNRLDIKLGDDNNIYTGFLAGSANIGSSIQLGNLSASMTSTNFNLSIGSVTSNGVPRWVRSFAFTIQTSGLAGATTIAVAGNKLFVGGYAGKYLLTFDNGQFINLGRCSSWMVAFNMANGQSIWTRAHGLYLSCLGLVCGCFTPTINANTNTGRVMLNNNLMGGFVFNGTDTIKSTNDPNIVIYKSYNTIYDTNNVPIKGKTIQTIPDGFSYNETLLGSRGNSVYATYRDSLRKMDTGYNLIWTKKLVGFDNFSGSITGAAFPPNSNDIILCYTKNGSNYLGKLSDSAAVVSGKVYADWDNNGVYTNTDSALSNILITASASPASAMSGIDSGKYYMYVVPGTYTLSANFNHPYYQFLPSSQSATAAQYGDSISGKDFRLRPLFAFTDVSTNISALNIARPGRLAYYTVTVKNFGATPQTIDVGLKLPSLSAYNSISGGTVTVNAPDSITISMGSVNPFETKKATLNLNIATTATITDTLRFYPLAYPYVTDIIQANNTDTLIQPVRTSFDPNEKEVNHGAQPLADTSNALLYTVHFQNTGTDTAFYVRIADTLSSKLDLYTFNFIDASHPVTTEINHNVISFTFNPIALPDSNHNEPQSHGFVKFSIKPLLPFAVTDTIFNNSAIYFDYNSAVITNSARSWFFVPVPLPVILQSFVADKKSSSVLLRFETASEADLNNFIIERSTDGINFTAIGSLKAKGTVSNGSSYVFEDLAPLQGVNFYRLKMVDKDLKTAYSWILVVKFSITDLQNISIFPNPANDNLYLSFRGITNPKVFTCTITDAGGKMLWAVNVNTSLRDTYTINTSFLPNGIYFITASGNGIIYNEKFAVKH